MNLQLYLWVLQHPQFSTPRNRALFNLLPLLERNPIPCQNIKTGCPAWTLLSHHTRTRRPHILVLDPGGPENKRLKDFHPHSPCHMLEMWWKCELGDRRYCTPLPKLKDIPPCIYTQQNRNTQSPAQTGILDLQPPSLHTSLYPGSGEERWGRGVDRRVHTDISTIPPLPSTWGVRWRGQNCSPWETGDYRATLTVCSTLSFPLPPSGRDEQRRGSLRSPVVSSLLKSNLTYAVTEILKLLG